jgi:putative radical SAM enzyme (TIGR03279 family)
MNKIKGVKRNSLADLAGVKAGDALVNINGKPVVDFLDYMYLSSASRVVLELSDRTAEIENEDFENLGLEFETMLIDKPKSCHNKCIFCFIDQNAPNMRESIYFKDDDYRLSFLQGNYISLTNLSDLDIAKIIEYNLPRINVSVHTTNPQLRVKMLNNPNAGNVLDIMRQFADNGISMNCQIVLCRGVNDEEELLRTIDDLAKLSPAIESVSVVPVGLTKFREGLSPLIPFDKTSANAVVKGVENCQAKLLDAIGTRFVYLADEFYLLAEQEIPAFKEYEDFLQIENGVGLISMFRQEFAGANYVRLQNARKKSIITGVAAYEFISNLVKATSPDTQVFPIKNEFFGESITVAGLVTGQDIIRQLKGKDLGDEILIPKCMLRAGETVFLDDVTLDAVEKELNVSVRVVSVDGSELRKVFS